MIHHVGMSGAQDKGVGGRISGGLLGAREVGARSSSLLDDDDHDQMLEGCARLGRGWRGERRLQQ
jgi:hypothetical protein